MFQIARFPVAESNVSWSTPLGPYSPPEFTAQFVLTAPWADPELGTREQNVNLKRHA